MNQHTNIAINKSEQASLVPYQSHLSKSAIQLKDNRTQSTSRPEINQGYLIDKRPQSVLPKQQADNKINKSIIQAKANSTGLPDNLKSGIENLSGHSMDDVKVHYNSSQPAQLNAHAYAQGTNIHVAPGQEKHLPHEAWHVVQQAQGRVHANKAGNLNLTGQIYLKYQ